MMPSMDGWWDGRMDGWTDHLMLSMDGWRDRWMDGRVTWKNFMKNDHNV
jgi:hypothetical protein